MNLTGRISKIEQASQHFIKRQCAEIETRYGRAAALRTLAFFDRLLLREAAKNGKTTIEHPRGSGEMVSLGEKQAYIDSIRWMPEDDEIEALWVKVMRYQRRKVMPAPPTSFMPFEPRDTPTRLDRLNTFYLCETDSEARGCWRQIFALARRVAAAQ